MGMDMTKMGLKRLMSRQSSDGESTTDEFLDLIADPFQAEVCLSSPSPIECPLHIR